MTTLDFASGEVVTAGTNGVSRSGIQPDWNGFAPRVGLAWTPARICSTLCDHGKVRAHLRSAGVQSV
jgi:hypothetical protein